MVGHGLQASATMGRLRTRGPPGAGCRLPRRHCRLPRGTRWAVTRAGRLAVRDTRHPSSRRSQLILYTDGLIERRNRDIGTGLTECGDFSAEPTDCPVRRAEPWSMRWCLLSVAMTLLCSSVGRGPWTTGTSRTGTTRRTHCRIPPASGSRSPASEWHLEELGFTTELIVSELATNAFRYAAQPSELRLIFDRALLREVSDCSSTSPRLRRAKSTDEGRRGLFLVARLAQRWGTRYTVNGNVI
ncbi:ATP-binding protein [Actinoallomurus sp. WRP6H-15]|nr:ATP-binding protein [Actinoallomurus soli]